MNQQHPQEPPSAYYCCCSARRCSSSSSTEGSHVDRSSSSRSSIGVEMIDHGLAHGPGWSAGEQIAAPMRPMTDSSSVSVARSVTRTAHGRCSVTRVGYAHLAGLDRLTDMPPIGRPGAGLFMTVRRRGGPRSATAGSTLLWRCWAGAVADNAHQPDRQWMIVVVEGYADGGCYTVFMK
jgi:hypothetical protein